jgi:uncharacterized protein with FMN-binding domain
MRRTKWRGTILFAVTLTVLGLTAGLRLYGVGTDAVAASSTSSTVAPATSSSGSSSASSSPSASAATPTPTPTPSASASTTSTAPVVVNGAVENTRFGPVQVQVTFVGTKITAVKTLQSPSDDGRSVSINSRATPMLEQEVLASQSAQIDTVSGATYTSDGYVQSVQSAIDNR